MNSTGTDAGLEAYEQSLLGVFGRPALVIDHGEGCHLVDVDGHRYLDLIGGIAVSALGHGHPALTDAIARQAASLLHASNLVTTPQQIELAQRLLRVAGAPEGSRVFLCNSGTEANEAAIKLARRTGRTGIVAAEGSFHGRSTGALALTHRPAYREPFAPLIPGVTHVPHGDVDALAAAVGPDTGAVILEAIQGEAGVIDPGGDYLVQARRITADAGALLVLDEVQTGVGRTGDWFAFQSAGIVPDAITVAKGLGGGVPVGGLVTMGEAVSGLLTVGQHGSTFGGNPLACAAAIAVLTTIDGDGLLQRASRLGDAVRARVAALGDDRLVEVRGRGLLLGLELSAPVAPDVVTAARAAGYLVNAPRPTTIRLAPPLVVDEGDLLGFVDRLPDLLDAVSCPHPTDPSGAAR